MTQKDGFISDHYARLRAALDGRLGEDQQLLATVGLDWVVTLLKKNADYGSTVFRPPQLAGSLPAVTGILVRMSDKIDRLRNLLSSSKPGEVAESIEDTMSDLGAYALLYLVVKHKEKSNESGSTTGLGVASHEGGKTEAEEQASPQDR